jgi:hypothetical protein
MIITFSVELDDIEPLALAFDQLTDAMRRCDGSAVIDAIGQMRVTAGDEIADWILTSLVVAGLTAQANRTD